MSEAGGPENTPQEDRTEQEPRTEEAGAFPIVGIGASAGGLEALKSFFAAVPEGIGMAFIVVVHMHPEQPSVMSQLLQRETAIPVTFAEDGERIAPGHAYVLPPNRQAKVYRGSIQLFEPPENRRILPVDVLFRSLGMDRGRYAVGVVLSGTGSDGTLGVKEIKNNDGLVLVQSPESAKYDGMPASAINTGIADKVLTPDEMADILAAYYQQGGEAASVGKVPEKENWLNKIFAILLTRVGHDFSVYKRNTILRRVQRRMGLNQIDDHETYIKFLRESPKEVEVLFRELLIGVTHFFRDGESFDVLKREIFPAMVNDLPAGGEFRVWVPGCSTGEEVYSLAIALQEYLDEHAKRLTVQFFGTDIDERAIAKAREGVYPANIAADVGEERLSRFFLQEHEAYRIRKDIRDKIVFSVQDLIKDPPFLRIDLLCCRNLLIYLESGIQKKLFPLFHYILKPGGVLMLGSSESLGRHTGLFEPLDSTWKIFQRKEVPNSIRGKVEFPTGVSRTEEHTGQSEAQPAKKADVSTLAREAVLELAAPTSVLIDGNGFILHVQGRTGKYLEAVSGPPSNNILDMAREGLRVELSTGLRNALSSGERVERKNLSVRTNGDVQIVDLTIHPLSKPKELEGRFLVVFEDVGDEAAEEETPPQGQGGTPESDRRSAKIRELEQELQHTRESHQTTIEELESSNEELKSTNEELQSSNEELQSTNEELESSKEEMQSLNEELQTVNAELQSKVEELSSAHDDMNNLLNGIEVAAIFVDNELRIRRFTSEAGKLINLIQSDIGRPLEHMGNNLRDDTLIEDIRTVLGDLAPRQREVRSTEEAWYLQRVVPYRTMDNRIDGAVITFLDIDDQKKAQLKLQEINREKEQSRLLIRKVFDMNPKPLAVLDSSGALVIANNSFKELMKMETEEEEGSDILSLENEVLGRAEMASQLQRALEENRDFETQEFSLDSGDGERRYFIRGQTIQQMPDEPYRLLLVFEECSEDRERHR